MHTPWAFLLCKFKGDDREPYTKQRFEDLFTSSGAGKFSMVDYFRDMSHGVLDLSGSEVFGWFTLDKTRSEYTGSGVNQPGRKDLITWARQKAIDKNVRLSWFFSVVVIMNVPETDLFGGPDGVVSDDARRVLPNEFDGMSNLSPSTLGQEMGHVYGLQHSRADGSTADYMDQWDVMSTVNALMTAHPFITDRDMRGRIVFQIGPGLNAANMFGRKWLDPTRVWTAGAEEFGATVQLRPLHHRDLPGYLAARVGQYFFEFRVPELWDAGIGQAVVLVHAYFNGNSYIHTGTSGNQYLMAGDQLERGDATDPLAPLLRVEVSSIDAAARTATLRVHSGPWVGWDNLGGVLPGMAAVGQNADGRLEVFHRGTDNILYQRWQTAPNNGWSSGWTPLGGIQISGDPVVASNEDGRLEVFVRGADSALWHIWQTAPNNGWSNWESLGGVLPGRAAVGQNADGRLEVFHRGTDNVLYTRGQTAPNNGWASSWESLGGIQISGDPVVASNEDGRLEVFVREEDNTLRNRWQTAPNNRWYGWSNWGSLGGILNGDPVVASNADGRLEAFHRGTDNVLYQRWQTAPNNGWAPSWESLGGVLPGRAAVGQNADGRLEVFHRGTDNVLYQRWQTASNNGWSSGWKPLGGKLSGDPVVASNEDGRLEIFVRGEDNALRNRWQTAPNNGWS